MASPTKTTTSPSLDISSSIQPQTVTGWALKKSEQSTVRLAIQFGGHEIGANHLQIPRADINRLLGRNDRSFGFCVNLDIGEALRIIAVELAAERSNPIPLTIGIADPSSATGEARVRLRYIGTARDCRTPQEWLAFFEFNISQEILARRTPKYQDTAAVAQVSDENWRSELLLSSMVSTNIVPFTNKTLETSGVIDDKLLIDKEYIARTLRDKHQLTLDFKDQLGRILILLRNLDINPHPLFFSRWYRKFYDLPDEAVPWIDYVCGGWKCGREPNPLFLTQSMEGLKFESECDGRLASRGFPHRIGR